MKGIKTTLLILVIGLNVVISAGCWNYREIDRLAIVAGVAVDKGTLQKYLITTEIVQTSGGKESKTTSVVISAEGDSIFDAIRNIISFTGMRLYWSHAKILIISEEIARTGCIDVVDWFIRDAETRSDIKLIISNGVTAKNILEAKKATEEVHSFELNDILTAQKSLGKAPIMELWRFSNELATEGSSAIAASIAINHENNEGFSILMGTAVFKRDKLIGFLSGEETRDLLIIRNKFYRGVLLYKKQGDALVSLEVFSSKTKVKPVVRGDNIEMELSTYTETAIDETESEFDYIEDEDRRKELERGIGKNQEMKIKQLIKKVQTQYGVDIFGFANKVREQYPKLWKQIGENWVEKFPDLQVSVNVKIHVRNSATLSKKLKVGD